MEPAGGDISAKATEIRVTRWPGGHDTGPRATPATTASGLRPRASLQRRPLQCTPPVHVATRHGVLSVATAGDGSAHRLLLVHGFTGAKEDFTEWLDPLVALGWEAAAVDLRGHGRRSSRTGLDSYWLEILADRSRGRGRRARDGTASCSLGHSMGGMVAQHVALSTGRVAPERLVLMDTSHGPVERIERQLAELACAVVAAGGMPALIEATDALQLRRRLPLTTPGPAAGAARAARATRSSTPASCWPSRPTPTASLAIDPVRAGRPPRGVCRRLDLPMLVMVGEEDTPFVEPSRRMAAASRGGATR